MSAREDLHAAIVEALRRRWRLSEEIIVHVADEILADPRVLPLIEGVGSEERVALIHRLKLAANGLAIHSLSIDAVMEAAALLRAGPTSEPVAWDAEMRCDRLDREWHTAARPFRTKREAEAFAFEYDRIEQKRIVPLFRSAAPTEAKEPPRNELEAMVQERAEAKEPDLTRIIDEMDARGFPSARAYAGEVAVEAKEPAGDQVALRKRGECSCLPLPEPTDDYCPVHGEEPGGGASEDERWDAFRAGYEMGQQHQARAHPTRAAKRDMGVRAEQRGRPRARRGGVMMSDAEETELCERCQHAKELHTATGCEAVIELAHNGTAWDEPCDCPGFHERRTGEGNEAADVLEAADEPAPLL